MKENMRFDVEVSFLQEDIECLLEKDGIVEKIEEICNSVEYNKLLEYYKDKIAEECPFLMINIDDSIHNEIRNCVMGMVLKFALEEWIEDQGDIHEIIRKNAIKPILLHILREAILSVIKEHYMDAIMFWNEELKQDEVFS